MTIPDEAVEAAAREFYGDAYGDVDGEELKYVLDQMRDTLEAAAPYLWATAYRAGHLDAATGVFRPWHQEEAAK